MPPLHTKQAPSQPNADHDADSLGCTSEKLHNNRDVAAGGLVFHRKVADTDAIGRVETSASDRGVLVGVSMTGGHRRRIFRGTDSSLFTFDEGGVYVRDFADDYRADLYGAFDFLLIEVPQPYILELAEENGRSASSGIRSGAGLHDPILANIARAVAPLVEHPGSASPLLLEQLGLVVGARLCEQYGDLKSSSSHRRARLSRAQEAMAKEMLLSPGDNQTTVADIARACRVSRSYFIQAFQETFGDTPHRWLMLQRVQQARGLLVSTDLSLADIAAGCGFSDQSHFSRMFAKVEGVSPGRWRKQSVR